MPSTRLREKAATHSEFDRHTVLRISHSFHQAMSALPFPFFLVLTRGALQAAAFLLRLLRIQLWLKMFDLISAGLVPIIPKSAPQTVLSSWILVCRIVPCNVGSVLSTRQTQLIGFSFSYYGSRVHSLPGEVREATSGISSRDQGFRNGLSQRWDSLSSSNADLLMHVGCCLTT